MVFEVSHKLYGERIMTIVDNKIISATEAELFDYWLQRYEECFTFSDWLYAIQRKGCVIEDVANEK